jgi:hypothetical protein
MHVYSPNYGDETVAAFGLKIRLRPLPFLQLQPCFTYSDTNSHSDADTKRYADFYTKTYTEASPDSAASPGPRR